MSKAERCRPFARSRNARPPLANPCRRLGSGSRRRLLLAVLASGWLGEGASAEPIERWQPLRTVGVLDNVVLRVHWFRNSDELRDAAKNSGQDIKDADLKGFSLLKRNTQTGAYVCDVYAV